MYQFENDEIGYRQWLRHNRRGFVLNYKARNPEPDNLILHSATCGTIAAPRSDGKGSTVSYGKACSESRAELEALAERWGGVAEPHDCLSN